MLTCDKKCFAGGRLWRKGDPLPDDKVSQVGESIAYFSEKSESGGRKQEAPISVKEHHGKKKAVDSADFFGKK